MKFSIFTVSMPEYNLKDTVTTIKQLGYDGVEWRVGNAAPAARPADYTYEGRYWSYNHSTLAIESLVQDAEEAHRLCIAEGLEICALATSVTINDTIGVELVLDAAARINCKNVRIDVPRYDCSENYRKVFEKARMRAQEAVSLSKKYGVRINYETHMGNIIPSASAAYRFVQGFDPAYTGVILDPGNMVFEGFENYKLGIELLGEYLAHVHIKNAAWYPEEDKAEGVTKWHPDWAPFRKGYADISKLLHDLEASGYRGYVSVEDFSNDQETYVKIKDNIDFLRSVLPNE